MTATVTTTLIAPNGDTLVLSRANGYYVTGLDDGGLPPLQMNSYTLSLQDGAVLSNITSSPRSINVLVTVKGSSQADIVSRVAALIKVLRPYHLQAPGAERYWILRRDIDGDSADIRVVPGGMINEQVASLARPVGVRLVALDPFWYGTERTRSLLVSEELDTDCIVGREGSIQFEDFAGGLDGRVHCMIEDTATGNLYVGGNFTNSISGVAMAHVGMWDGTTWNALGTGMNNIVRAFYWDATAGKLYAGGDFTTADGGAANFIAVWDGAAWSALGAGTNNTVRSIVSDGTFLYIGGDFTTAGGGAAARVASYKPSASKPSASTKHLTGIWGALGAGMNFAINALEYDSSTTTLYAGGDFTTADGGAALYIAAWNGAAWSAVGGGMNNSVNALELDAVNGLLYAGGVFTDAGGSGAGGIAVWDGVAWARLSASLNDAAALYFDPVDELLYIGGKQVGIAGIDFVFVANGTTTLDVVATADANVYAVLLTSDRVLVTGGAFTVIDGVAVGYIASWTRRGWSNLAGGMNNDVYAMTIGPDGYLYAGGAFTTAGGVTVNRIARWVGGGWEDLDGGIDNGVVRALEFGPDGTLYVGGTFTAIGGVAINRIAAWDGAAWSALGTGMNSTVYALQIAPNGYLYAAGAFTTADGGAAAYIAVWNGAAWSALGAGTNATIYALAYDEALETLYAGGGFITAGGGGAAYVAAWDGAAWSALGAGLNDVVYALELGAGGLLYVGGVFTTAGGNTANYLAQWNGASWSAVGGPAGTGLNNPVWRLVYADDGTLYVAGEFTTAGTLSLADYVVRWNGYTYAALPFDLPAGGYILALAVDGDGDRIYFGGTFTGTADIAGAYVVNNPGGLETPLVFEIEGPGTLISIRNESTNVEMFFYLWLNAGETLTVNLTPGEIGITSDWRGRLEALPNSAFNLMLAADPVVTDGDNMLSIFVLSATADTAASVTFTPRWYDWESAVQ